MALHRSTNKNGLKFLEDAMRPFFLDKFLRKSMPGKRFILAHFYLKGDLEKDKYLNLLKNVGNRSNTEN